MRLGVGVADVLDFSSNADSLVDDITRGIVRSIDYPYAYYPDDDCAELTADIAADEAVSSGQVLVGNGSSELIFLTLQALRPSRVVIVAPVFSEYARACASLGIEHRAHLLRVETGFALTAADVESLVANPADMLVLCTPCNPTTAVYGREELAGLLGSGRFAHVLMDHTYREFLHGAEAFAWHGFAPLARLAAPDTRVMSLESFTKAFYCPGIRLGHLVADEETIRRVRAVKPPWTVSRFAETAGLAFLRSRGAYRERRGILPELRGELRQGLRNTGLFAAIHASEVNFLLARLAAGVDGRHMQRFLLKSGVLVRVCDDVYGMEPGFLRLQVRDRADNTRLLVALAGYSA
jgi:threonine-phosphate decarboxylase